MKLNRDKPWNTDTWLNRESNSLKHIADSAMELWQLVRLDTKTHHHWWIRHQNWNGNYLERSQFGPNAPKKTAEEVLGVQSRSSNRKIAEDILIQELGGGGAIPCKQLYQKAEDQGISKKVLWSAAKRLNVKVDKGGFNDGWLWQLPSEASPDRKSVV